MAVANSDYIAAENFGVPLPASSAPGTQGAQVTASRGDLATVSVTPAYGGPAYTVAVDAADTSGMSSDASNRLSFSGGDQTSASWTAGTSHIGTRLNPNAAEVQPLADQVRAAR